MHVFLDFYLADSYFASRLNMLLPDDFSGDAELYLASAYTYILFAMFVYDTLYAKNVSAWRSKLEIFDFSKSLQFFALNNITSVFRYILLQIKLFQEQ